MPSGNPVRAQRNLRQRSSFERQALRQIREAGRKKQPLAGLEITITRENGDTEVYSPLGVMVSYPFLLKGIRHSFNLKHSRQLAAMTSDHQQDPTVALELHTKNLQQDLLALFKQWNKGELPQGVHGSYSDPVEPYTFEPIKLIDVDKIKPKGELSPERIKNLWEQDYPFPPEDKKRPLAVASYQDRAVIHAACSVFSTYLSTRWPNFIVGSRPGVGIAQILSAFRQAVLQTKMNYLLLSDISGFYDNIEVSKAFDQLEKRCQYRSDPILKGFVELVARPPESTKKKHIGLPQGNAFSGLLANLIGWNTLDATGKRYGPYMRYVDDLIVLVPNATQGLKAFAALQDVAENNHLQLHPKKSILINLTNNQQFDLTQRTPTPTVTEPCVYLGMTPQCDDQYHLTFHLHDIAIFNLLLRLHDIATGPDRYRNRPLDAVELLNERFESIRHTLLGWLQAYGAVSWNENQKKCLRTLLRCAHVVSADLIIDKAPDLVRSQWDTIFARPANLTWTFKGKQRHTCPQNKNRRFEERGEVVHTGLYQSPEPVTYLPSQHVDTSVETARDGRSISLIGGDLTETDTSQSLSQFLESQFETLKSALIAAEKEARQNAEN